MANLRDYEELVRSYVSEFNENDMNWDWGIKSYAKDRVRIRWTYLDYCEEKNNCFFLTLSEESCDDGEWILSARYPDGEVIACYIVSENPVKFWQDSFEEAIKNSLNSIFHIAYSRY